MDDFTNDFVEQIRCFSSKASVYEAVVRETNQLAELDLPIQAATGFKVAHESLQLKDSGGPVTLSIIWQLIKALVGEDSADVDQTVSKKMLLVQGARRHLESVHEESMNRKIRDDPDKSSHGKVLSNLERVRAFLRIRLGKNGVLDFDAVDDECRQQVVYTTWQQVYLCMRTGYYDEVRELPVSEEFAALFTEWMSTGGLMSQESAAAATTECENMLGEVDYDKQKLMIYAILSGSPRQIEWFPMGIQRTLFRSMLDFLWFKLASVRDCGGANYSLDDLHAELRTYSRKEAFPLVQPYTMLLSILLLPAILNLIKETPEEDGYGIDAVHMLVALAAKGVFSDDVETGQGPVKAVSEAVSIIRQYGSAYMQAGNISGALEYYAQAVFVMFGRTDDEFKEQKLSMLKEILSEVLLHQGGVAVLLGAQGADVEGQLGRFVVGAEAKDFLVDFANRCEDHCIRRQVQRYIVSHFPSSSNSLFVQENWWTRTNQRRDTPGAIARGKEEWEKTRKCLFCIDKPISWSYYPELLNHQLVKHKKDMNQ